MWYQSEFPKTRTNWLTCMQTRNKAYSSWFKFIYVHKYQNITTPKGRYMPNNYVKNNEHKEPVK